MDRERHLVATASVVFEKDFCSGSIQLDRMPEPLLRLFEEYEAIINDQIFSLLDSIEDRINALGLVVDFADGERSPVKNLQIFPGNLTISFEVVSSALLGDRR